jgi:predicted nucleic acid-binding protein
MREEAPRLVFYTLVSFAASVSLTRLFLELTGFPQIGGGELHIAHVLWGGLLLFIASMVPILYSNRWALVVDALLAGTGVGLFIDEVGKFITRTNNYFFPAAAPIIYAFFLMTVLLYLEVRKPRKRDARAELYSVLDEIEEVLDDDLSESEKAHILKGLEKVERETKQNNLLKLIQSLKGFILSDAINTVPDEPGWLERSRQKAADLHKKWLHKRQDQIALAICLFLLGLWSLRIPALLIAKSKIWIDVNYLLTYLIGNGMVRSSVSLRWFEIQLALQTAVGVILLAASLMLFFKKDRLGILCGYLSLLLSLTVVNLLMFYFDQFSTILTALVELIVLLLVVIYRRAYLMKISREVSQY